MTNPPQPPYIIDGIVYSTDGTTAVSGAEVFCVFKGEKVKKTANSLGQYRFNLADEEFGGVAYSVGDTVRLWAWNTTYMVSTIHTLTDTGAYDWSPTLGIITHSNMMMLAQHVIYQILKDDSTVSHYNIDIIDKELEWAVDKLESSFIVVKSPESTEDVLTIGGSGISTDEITMDIHLLAKETERGREVVNAIRAAIEAQESRLKSSNLWLNKMNISHTTELDGRLKPYVRFICKLRLLWYGV